MSRSRSDVFFFEQDGAFVVRLMLTGQAGTHHQLTEFTKDDIAGLVAQGPQPSLSRERAPARSPRQASS